MQKWQYPGWPERASRPARGRPLRQPRSGMLGAWRCDTLSYAGILLTCRGTAARGPDAVRRRVGDSPKSPLLAALAWQLWPSLTLNRHLLLTLAAASSPRAMAIKQLNPPQLETQLCRRLCLKHLFQCALKRRTMGRRRGRVVQLRQGRDDTLMITKLVVLKHRPTRNSFNISSHPPWLCTRAHTLMRTRRCALTWSKAPQKGHET